MKIFVCDRCGEQEKLEGCARLELINPQWKLEFRCTNIGQPTQDLGDFCNKCKKEIEEFVKQKRK